MTKRIYAILVPLLVILPALAFAGGTSEKGNAGAQAQASPQTVQFWYHLDNPQAVITPIVEEFQKANPNIKIDAVRIPWSSYYQKLVTAIAGSSAPDASLVKLWWQPQLVSLGALQPLDSWLSSWNGKSDIYPSIWKLTTYNGKNYYMPLQDVILYVYYRTDYFKNAGIGTTPKTADEFLADAEKLTGNGVYGFGIRGAAGGHDFWLTFVGPYINSFTDAGLTTQSVIDANQWYINLFRKYHVAPPSAPSDGFNETIANMKNGKTAMTIHHIGSAAGLVAALGDKIGAFVVPAASNGKRWTSFGDEETAMYATSKVKDATWKWISYLATAAPNLQWVKASGQVSVDQSNANVDYGVLNPFMKVTAESMPYAQILPSVDATTQFVNTVWPATMQQAFLGQITSTQMMDTFGKLYGSGK